jgi:hypothetical protein
MGAMQSGDERGLWRVGPSPIHGQGVFLRREVLAGTLIGVGIKFFLGIFPHITSDLGAWINHSNSPSTSLLLFDGNYWIVANRALAADEELTLHYRKTPWYIAGPEAHYA